MEILLTRLIEITFAVLFYSLAKAKEIEASNKNNISNNSQEPNILQI